MEILTKLGLISLVFASSTLQNILPESEVQAQNTNADSKGLELSVQTMPVLSPAPLQHKWDTEDTKALIRARSAEYGVSEGVMLSVVSCEAGQDMASTTIQSRYYKNGVREESYGLVQINLPQNPKISYEQATDPYFAIDFLAKNLKAGRGYLWTCYRQL